MEHGQGQNSLTYGYIAGSSPGGVASNVIQKFPFASNTNSTNVGDLTVARGTGAGHSSVTHGFVSGGDVSGANNTIDKFTFASDANSADHGDCYVAVKYCNGCSSTTHGYNYGMTGSNMNQIQKFATASNTTGTDVGNLTQDHDLPTGNQQY